MAAEALAKALRSGDARAELVALTVPGPSCLKESGRMGATLYPCIFIYTGIHYIDRNMYIYMYINISSYICIYISIHICIHI